MSNSTKLVRKEPLNTTEVTQQKCRASSGRWHRGGLTLVAPSGLLALRLRRNGPVCGCDGGLDMSGVGTAELASRRG
ncbi:hypothetical protein ACOMHN_035631 [Nucella lapillus]